MDLFFFHGKSTGPHGAKYQTLTREFGEVESPSFEGLDLEARLAIADAETRGRRDLLIVGSSMGGLLALLLYQRHPERFAGLVLCAPALSWPEAEEIHAAPANTLIVHGTGDTVIPIAASRAFAGRFSIELVEVDDGHRLAESHEAIVSAVSLLRARRQA